MKLTNGRRQTRRAQKPRGDAKRPSPWLRRPLSVRVLRGIGCRRWLLLVLLPVPAAAHPGGPPQPHDIWTAWTLDPAVLLLLGVSGWTYARGVRALWARAGADRGVRRWQACAFAAALSALFVALVSPLDALGEALFSAHMVQHLLLMVVAAPLIALSSPLLVFMWALPRHRRLALVRRWRALRTSRRVVHRLTRPGASWVLATVALWVWHVPAFYDAAVGSAPLHLLEHASFFLTAVLFWWALADPAGPVRAAYGAGLIYLFTAAMQSAGLGALLTLATRTWYGAHLESTAAWGLTPLQDQHVAGAIMWVPPSVIYLGALGVVLVLWLRAAERRALAMERQETAVERAAG